MPADLLRRTSSRYRKYDDVCLSVLPVEPSGAATGERVRKEGCGFQHGQALISYKWWLNNPVTVPHGRNRPQLRGFYRIALP